MGFKHLLYETEGRIATITLNRPERFNAICIGMPVEIREAVERANRDDGIHVIILQAAGKGFCGGYDLVDFAEQKEHGIEQGTTDGTTNTLWDPMVDFQMMYQNTKDFMSLWNSYKPTIAKVHGDAVAGGSDIALCCDLVIMSETARIGYPPARVWGCPTTAMWVYRIGAEKAKRMLLTGDLVTGQAAEKLGLILEAVPAADLDDRVRFWAERMQGVPRNQLMMQKLMINQAFENMGMQNTQMMATLFDGITRHSPEGAWFKKRAQEAGFKQAVKERDSGDPIAEGVSKPTYRF
ncbi:crotonase/enoyl-CoA hydratase family protein [bacterium]|nr:crotonase/enoyl-CoA hydratase family protein [bacterium]